MPTALQVRGLHVEFATPQGVIEAVHDVSFTLNRGEILGLVGESGSGKSTTAYALLGLTPPPGRVVGGEVLLSPSHGDTLDLCRASPKVLQQVRGNRISMIFQDPVTALNPVLRIDTQMTEIIQAHARVSNEVARARALQGLIKVGIASPEDRLLAYPHQLSGGMRQRVAIAIAMLNEPDLIIADEPTTALDVTVQAQILAAMQTLCRDTGTALIWITHDLSVVAGLADTVAVMYAGRIVEQGTVAQVLNEPAHPYTLGLLNSRPSRTRPQRPLQQIPGMAPSLGDLPPGCAFAPRCKLADAACRDMPASLSIAGRQVRCFHPLSMGQRMSPAGLPGEPT